MRAGAGIAAVAVLGGSLQIGCERCSRRDAPNGAGPSAAASSVKLDVPKAPLVKTGTVSKLDVAKGIGLPANCRVEFPIRTIPVGSRDLRFGSTRSHLFEIALLEQKGDTLAASSIFNFESGKSMPSPWLRADAPPPWDRASSGWFAGLIKPKEGTVHSAAFWRSAGPAKPGVDGDQMEIADLACDGDTCAMLTSLARESRAPGASLAWSDGHAPVHIATPAAAPWQPLSIVSLSAQDHQATVALQADGSVMLWSITGSSAKAGGKLVAPHGIYDVVDSEPPLVIAPGIAPKDKCQDGHFPLRAHRIGGASAGFNVSGAPHGVYARPLSGGAIVAWIAPATCRLTERTTVGAILLDPAGKPIGSPMVVAEANGFAISTQGDRVALWLLAGQQLKHLTARCNLSSQ